MSQNIDQIFTANPITTNASTDLMYFGQSPYGSGDDAAMTYANFSAQFGAPYTPAALTEVNDTNVTLTLGGTPATALLHAVSITAGWTGTLSGTRGGTGVNNGSSTITIGGSFAMSGAYTFTGTLTNTTAVTFPTSGTLATTSQLPTPAALTEVNDTNVTLTLGGTPSTALLQATSITAGWTGTLAVGRGGLGINTVPTDGQIPIGNGTNYVASTLSAGTNISINNGAGVITINNTAAAGISPVNQTSSTVTLAANTRYIINNGASLVTLTLPASPTIGDTFYIVGQSSGGWTVAQNASQTCHLGSSATTTGTGGSASSSNQYDCITITYSGTNTFTIYDVQGNITIV